MYEQTNEGKGEGKRTRRNVSPRVLIATERMASINDGRLFKNVSTQSTPLFFFTPNMYSTRARVLARGERKRPTFASNASPSSDVASPTPPRDRRRRPTDDTRNSPRAGTWILRRSNRWRRTRPSSNDKKPLALEPNPIQTRRRRHQPSGTLTSPPTSTAFARVGRSSVGRHPRVL